SDFLKLLKINFKTNPHKIENFGMMPIPTGAIEKGEIRDLHVISNVLRYAINEFSVLTKNIAVAIPRSSTIIKNITANIHLTKPEIETRVRIEADRQFPNLISDIY